jgi:hypothetical protein
MINRIIERLSDDNGSGSLGAWFDYW